MLLCPICNKPMAVTNKSLVCENKHIQLNPDYKDGVRLNDVPDWLNKSIDCITKVCAERPKYVFAKNKIFQEGFNNEIICFKSEQDFDTSKVKGLELLYYNGLWTYSVRSMLYETFLRQKPCIYPNSCPEECVIDWIRVCNNNIDDSPIRDNYENLKTLSALLQPSWLETSQVFVSGNFISALDMTDEQLLLTRAFTDRYLWVSDKDANEKMIAMIEQIADGCNQSNTHKLDDIDSNPFFRSHAGLQKFNACVNALIHTIRDLSLCQHGVDFFNFLIATSTPILVGNSLLQDITDDSTYSQCITVGNTYKYLWDTYFAKDFRANFNTYKYYVLQFLPNCSDVSVVFNYWNIVADKLEGVH